MVPAISNYTKPQTSQHWVNKHETANMLYECRMLKLYLHKTKDVRMTVKYGKVWAHDNMQMDLDKKWITQVQ